MPGTEDRLETMLSSPTQREQFGEAIKDAFLKLGFHGQELSDAVELTLKKLSSRPTVESGVTQR